MVAVYGIVRSESLGWGSLGVLGPLGLAVVLLGAFALVEGRFAAAPLLPLSVLRMPRLRAANLVIALLYAGVFAMWFFLTLYMQQVLGYSALGSADVSEPARGEQICQPDHAAAA